MLPINVLQWFGIVACWNFSSWQRMWPSGKASRFNLMTILCGSKNVSGHAFRSYNQMLACIKSCPSPVKSIPLIPRRAPPLQDCSSSLCHTDSARFGESRLDQCDSTVASRAPARGCFLRTSIGLWVHMGINMNMNIYILVHTLLRRLDWTWPPLLIRERLTIWKESCLIQQLHMLMKLVFVMCLIVIIAVAHTLSFGCKHKEASWRCSKCLRQRTQSNTA